MLHLDMIEKVRLHSHVDQPKRNEYKQLVFFYFFTTTVNKHFFVRNYHTPQKNNKSIYPEFLTCFDLQIYMSV